MAFLSIVIPIYNAEKYLDRCIRSVLEQDYKDIQLVLVNDGSKDRSDEICCKYCSDDRVKYIKQDNGGVSSARNTGIRNSTGKYIMFADSDDSYTTSSITKIVNHIDKQSADILIFNYNKFSEDGAVNTVFLTPGVYTKNEYLRFIGIDNPAIYFNKIYNKVYSNEIIRGNNILFPEEKSIGEDIIFNLQYFKYCKSFSCISESFYNYRVDNSDSLMHSNIALDIDNECENIEKVVKYIFNDYSDEMEEIKRILDGYVLRSFNSFSLNLIRKYGSIKAYPKIKHCYNSIYHLDVINFDDFKYKRMLKTAWKNHMPWLLLLRIKAIDFRYKCILFIRRLYAKD